MKQKTTTKKQKSNTNPEDAQEARGGQTSRTEGPEEPEMLGKNPNAQKATNTQKTKEKKTEGAQEARGGQTSRPDKPDMLEKAKTTKK